MRAYHVCVRWKNGTESNFTVHAENKQIAIELVMYNFSGTQRVLWKYLVQRAEL